MLSCRTNEFMLLCLKKLGRIAFSNCCLLRTSKLDPSSDQRITDCAFLSSQILKSWSRNAETDLRMRVGCLLDLTEKSLS